MATPLQQLCAIGQSPWYDSIQRSLITSGGLQALIDRGIRGVTVNPAIFEKAILGSTDYDVAIQGLLTRGSSPAVCPTTCAYWTSFWVAGPCNSKVMTSATASSPSGARRPRGANTPSVQSGGSGRRAGR